MKNISIYIFFAGSIFLIFSAYFSSEFLKKVNLKNPESVLSNIQFDTKVTRQDIFFDWPIEVSFISNDLRKLSFKAIDPDNIIYVIFDLERSRRRHLHSITIVKDKTENVFHLHAIFQR